MANVNNIVCIALAIFVGSMLCTSQGLPAPDEERYLDKEYNRELINWLNALHYPQQLSSPCKYYAGNGYVPPMPKRNSELINSLLSLPKSMNDAGK